MNSGAEYTYLHGYLAHLAPFLERPDVTDIYVNRPGEVWVETRGAGAEKISAPVLTNETLQGLVRQVAAFSSQGISRDHPILTASLPTGERIQAVVPPATRGNIAIAIRRHSVSKLRLEDFFDKKPDNLAPSKERRYFGDGLNGNAASICSSLRSAVLARKNIIVSGGTSTGKTTFLNTLIDEIPLNERLLFIEDTPELRYRHENAVGLLAARGALREAQIDTNDLLTASLRMRPERIILGELRGNEAVTFLRAVNTGHPGSMTTIHADTADGAFEQLAFLTLQAGLRLAWSDLLAYIRATINISVHLERSGAAPSVFIRKE